MKPHRTLTWMFLLLFTSTLTGVQPTLDAEVQTPEKPPERVVEPGQKIGDRTTDLEEAPDMTDGCGAEVIGKMDRTITGPRPWTREVVTFAVQFKDEVSPYRVMSMFALPGEEIEIEAVLGDRQSVFSACADGGELTRQDKDEWTWRAPSKPGVYSVYVNDRRAGETMLLNAIVMVPYDGEDELDGYHIGSYERVPLRNNPAYRVPRGMIEVTPDMLDVWLSPHFQLRQFLCKQQPSEFPKYLIVSERLLLKLESLLEKVNDKGLEADTFAVLSGFRTPQYNRTIGNKTRYSRHLYGDAADIYIDNDEDGRMDDLNGDGKSNAADARVLARIVEDSVDEAWYRPFIGGLGLYGAAPHRGPFIHVDTRGFRARWSSGT